VGSVLGGSEGYIQGIEGYSLVSLCYCGVGCRFASTVIVCGVSGVGDVMQIDFSPIRSLHYHTSYCITQVCGNIVKADVMLEPTGRSKGFGIVQYSNGNEAASAVQRLNNLELKGRMIWVREDIKVI
jgi:hypothetical protein